MLRVETMATARLIMNLKKECECSICRSEFTDPKTLPCLHTFCTGCLQSYIHAKAFKKRKGFECPLCRKFVHIPKPGKAKNGWAEQFAKDFRVISLQSEIKEHETAQLKENVIPLPTGNRSPVLVSNTKIFPRVDSVGSHTNLLLQSERQSVNPDSGTFEEPKIIKPSNSRSVMKLTGQLVSTVAIAEKGSKMPYACDLVALEQNGAIILATLDFENNKLITLNLDSEMKVKKMGNLDLGSKPWRICKVKDTEVAITVNKPNCILICNISNDVTEVMHRVPTTKNYDGIAFMFDGFVTTTKDNVDILGEDGTVCCEHEVKSPNTKYTYNSYVTVTSDDNVVVTDSEGKALSCLTKEGKINWQKKGNFSGVTSTTDGVFVSDVADGAVYQYSARGRRLSKVAEVERPSGVFADDNGHLFVVCDNINVNVYKLIAFT